LRVKKWQQAADDRPQAKRHVAGWQCHVWLRLYAGEYQKKSKIKRQLSLFTVHCSSFGAGAELQIPPSNANAARQGGIANSAQHCKFRLTMQMPPNVTSSA